MGPDLFNLHVSQSDQINAIGSNMNKQKYNFSGNFPVVVYLPCSGCQAVSRSEKSAISHWKSRTEILLEGSSPKLGRCSVFLAKNDRWQVNFRIQLNLAAGSFG